MTLFRHFCIGLTAASLLLVGCVRSAPNYKNHVVVQVNNSALNAAEFSQLLATRLKVFNVLSAKDSSVVTQAKNAIVQDFIVSVVTTEWAQAKQLFVRKELLEEEIEKVRKNYPDDISFRKALADEGLTYDTWENRTKQTLLERLVLTELRKQLKKPTPEQIKSYYDQNKAQFLQEAAVHLRQIVLSSEDAAQRIKKELAAGKSLASLAKKFSITSEADLGGDIGWIEKGSLDIFDAAFKMNTGQRSQIVKSPFGYHVFEVLAKRQAKTLTLDDVRPKIEKLLTEKLEQDLYSTWLEEQILKARVFKDDEFLKQIKVQTRGGS